VDSSLKGTTYRTFRGGNVDPKLYFSGWGGGSAGRIKTYNFGKTIGYAGKLIGGIQVAGSIYNTATGKNDLTTGAFDLTFGLIGTFGSWPGALVSASYELGKLYGPSKW